MILIIDNYDSFVHNLGRYFRQLGLETRVVRNDEVDCEQVRHMKPQAMIISPGPCTPDEAGCSVELIKEFSDAVPILGVCLGHQAIAQDFGGKIIRANEPMHGRSSKIIHNRTGLFSDIRSPITAGRYHSLVVEQNGLPDCLTITAKTEDGTIMAIQHKSLPIIGVQFHPESILTEMGYVLLTNFLRIAGLDVCVPDAIPRGVLVDLVGSNFLKETEQAVPKYDH